MEKMIARLMNGENVEIMEVPNFKSFEDAKPFMIECGKAARKIANDNEDSIFAKKMMTEIENAWYSALHADCGFMVYEAACKAFGWLKKMVESYC